MDLGGALDEDIRAVQGIHAEGRAHQRKKPKDLTKMAQRPKRKKQQRKTVDRVAEHVDGAMTDFLPWLVGQWPAGKERVGRPRRDWLRGAFLMVDGLLVCPRGGAKSNMIQVHAHD